jgi:hypothetical protein
VLAPGCYPIRQHPKVGAPYDRRTVVTQRDDGAELFLTGWLGSIIFNPNDEFDRIRWIGRGTIASDRRKQAGASSSRLRGGGGGTEACIYNGAVGS